MKDKIITALSSMIWYDGVYVEILPLIEAMNNFKLTDHYFGYDDAKKVVPAIGNFDTYENFLWGMLTEMFGECGTSPRTGWIENTDACVKFLQSIIDKIIEECYNGDKEWFKEDLKDE